MIERWAAAALFIAVSSEPLLASFVGGRIAALLVVAPITAVAYRAILIRPATSGTFRLTLRQFAIRLRARPVQSGLLLTFCAMLVVSILRAAGSGSLPMVTAAAQLLKWTSVLAILAVVAAEALAQNDRSRLMRLIVLGFLAYAGANAALYLAGVRNQLVEADYLLVPERALMLYSLGIDVTRASLPIGSGINTSGLQAASGMALAAGLWRGTRGALRPARAWWLMMCSVVCVLATDSRGAMLAGIVGAAVCLLPATLRPTLRWAAILIPLSPLFVLYSMRALSNVVGVSALSRAGADALSGRPLIWGSIASFLASFQPLHLVGYGAVGQVTSGANARYAFLFDKTTVSTASAGAHNTQLQAILDVGYIGAAVQLILFWNVLSVLSVEANAPEREARWALAGLCAAITLLVLGATGETLSVTTPNTLVLFLALNAYALTSSANDSRAVDLTP